MAKNFKSLVISFGRITIPKTIRDELKISEGDYVEVEGIKKLELVESNPAKEA